MKPLRSDLADLAGVADGHDGPVVWKIHALQRFRVSRFQCVVSVHMKAARNEPLCAIFRSTYIQDSHGSVLCQPILKRFDIDLWHLCTVAGVLPWRARVL